MKQRVRSTYSFSRSSYGPKTPVRTCAASDEGSKLSSSTSCDHESAIGVKYLMRTVYMESVKICFDQKAKSDLPGLLWFPVSAGRTPQTTKPRLPAIPSV